MQTDAFGETFHGAAKVGASINVTLHEVSAVTVYGLRGSCYGQYDVTFAGNTTSFIAKSSFETQSVLFSATEMDPTVDYQLVVTNIGDGGQLGIASINTTSIMAVNAQPPE
jgi:hypothetical protein